MQVGKEEEEEEGKSTIRDGVGCALEGEGRDALFLHRVLPSGVQITAVCLKILKGKGW